MSPLYYQESDVTVSWDSHNRWVVARWRNMPSAETVMKGCEEMLRLLILQKGTTVFNDNSEVTGTWVGASNWVAEQWFPRMIACGLRRFAWIESPTSTLSVISAKKSVRRNQCGVIRLFKTAIEGELWLLEETGARCPAERRDTPGLQRSTRPQRFWVAGSKDAGAFGRERERKR